MKRLTEQTVQSLLTKLDTSIRQKERRALLDSVLELEQKLASFQKRIDGLQSIK
ncbi:MULTISPECIES: hypothetical protein [Jeotgalibacillus]|uniref:hypothetical protein n=1 Tax=Jeotgalibacillus TaxID=157226 RepID=UPI00141BECC0|nr:MULTISPECIES: hypothetical protein [Jeotgalibacillus]